ncbi:hypothetical protein ACP70R_022299 [Stipagrostis hirtigluma subsp. patula]
MVLTRSAKGKEPASSSGRSSAGIGGSRRRPILLGDSGSASRGGSTARRGESRGRTSSGDDGHDSDESTPVSPLCEMGCEIPPSYEDDDWGGVATGTRLRCRHGLRPRRKICWDGKHTGRRFLGCGLEDGNLKCRFVEWCDPAWSQRAQAVILTLWDVVEDFRQHELQTIAEIEEEVQRIQTLHQSQCERAESEKKRAWMVAFLFAGLLVATMVGMALKMTN